VEQNLETMNKSRDELPFIGHY